MLLTTLLILAAAGTSEKVDDRPVCGPTLVHSFWPAAANSNPQALHLAARCGDLQICTRHNLRYGWRPLTVSATGKRTGCSVMTVTPMTAVSDPATLNGDARKLPPISE